MAEQPSALPLAATDYAIVPASLRDLRAVHRLERGIFPHDAYPWIDLILLFLLPTTINMKALTPAGALAGFVSGGSTPGDPRIWIITLGVDPDHRRRGLGRRLLETMEQRLNVEWVYLTVRESNGDAIRLYEASGYVQTRLRPRYYRGGEAGIEMRKWRR